MQTATNTAASGMNLELNAFDFHILSQFGQVVGYSIHESVPGAYLTYRINFTTRNYLHYMKDGKDSAILVPEEGAE